MLPCLPTAVRTTLTSAVALALVVGLGSACQADPGGQPDQARRSAATPSSSGTGTGTGSGTGTGTSGSATSSSAETVRVRGAGTDFTATVPRGSVATYRWLPASGWARAWLTSPDGEHLALAAAVQPSLRRTTSTEAARAATTLTVDARRVGQPMEGFGAALTQVSAQLVNRSPERSAILRQLFSPLGTSRLSVLRVPMGATDLSTDGAQSYDDSLVPDPQLTRFSIAQDEGDVIPVLKRAAALQPGLRLIAAPWSAPGWMKAGGTFRGTCAGDANRLLRTYEKAYAQYFVRFLQAYAEHGLRFSKVSVVNEPQHCSADYPTMTMSADQQARVARLLRSALDAAGFRGVGILAYEHNWYDQGTEQTTSYPADVLAQARGAVSGVAYHCYAGGHEGAWAGQVTGVPVYMTECTGSYAYRDTRANLAFEVGDALIGPIRHGARMGLYWALAQDPRGSRHTGGCGNCRGLVTVDPDQGTAWPEQDLAYWSHFSAHVHRGARKIWSSQAGSFRTVAFRNPTGSVVLVVLNKG